MPHMCTVLEPGDETHVGIIDRVAVDRGGAERLPVNLLRCPACGPFGILARQRNRRAADAALIAFHAALAAEVRAERAEAGR